MEDVSKQLEENEKQETENRKQGTGHRPPPGAPIFHFPFSVSRFLFSILFMQYRGRRMRRPYPEVMSA
jgi:hypothetical protein